MQRRDQETIRKEHSYSKIGKTKPIPLRASPMAFLKPILEKTPQNPLQ